MIVIEHNGSKWAGSPPDPLGKLLDMLASHPLDRKFETYGCFCYEPRIGVRDIDAKGRPIWIDGAQVYPENPYAVRFWGNFFTYSHGFQIDTDDAEVIEVLHAAIETNRARTDYLAQVA